MFSGMFNSCAIHSVQINLNQPQDAKSKLFELYIKKFFQLGISLLEVIIISILVDSCLGCHPNFEPIEFKLAHVKRKLMLIN